MKASVAIIVLSMALLSCNEADTKIRNLKSVEEKSGKLNKEMEAKANAYLQANGKEYEPTNSERQQLLDLGEEQGNLEYDIMSMHAELTAEQKKEATRLGVKGLDTTGQ